MFRYPDLKLGKERQTRRLKMRKEKQHLPIQMVYSVDLETSHDKNQIWIQIRSSYIYPVYVMCKALCFKKEKKSKEKTGWRRKEKEALPLERIVRGYLVSFYEALFPRAQVLEALEG